MKKILCLNNISKIGLEALPKDYSIVSEIKDADAILVRSANMLEMELPEKVLAVARAGAGVNNIPLEPYAKKGVVVFNTPGANANAVKELTIAGMLLAARDIFGGMKWVELNKGDAEINKSMEKAKAQFAGTEILGKTIGIFGLGAVGSLIANAAGGLGMHVVGYEPSEATIKRNEHLFPRDIKLVKSPDELYAVADYISLNVPLLPATKGMINKDSISKMKSGVIILNIARDAIVNDADMKVALEERKVRTYVTDFPNFASANMAHVVAMPHLGASTEEAEDNCAKMAAEEVSDYIDHGNIRNSVNFPSLDLGALKGHRVVVLYENIEGLAASVQQEVNKHVKVSKMVSGVKNAFGASIFDVDKAIDPKLLALKGVLKVRVL